MEVILADYLGFCYGVKRAITIAQENASSDGKACTLGPIIHNPQMVERLRSEGVGTVDELAEMDEGTIIIRSHGVGPRIYAEAERRGLELVDATCPHVKKAQLSAKALVDDGYSVVIIGEKRHPEVHSIFEWSDGKAAIVETEEEAEALHSCAKLGIVCQTTFSGAKFKQIVSRLLEKSRDIRIQRTICTATDQRQAAALALAAKVDLMLVIGGKNSANTTRLARICEEKCLTYHIETAEELQDEWFDKIEKIGITAGASTPDWIIKEVYKKCQNR
ncbi:4-hydroxy-3-methylbut-2-enyl diphosphate reductase [Selenomonas sp.]|uniref:4-hydroxy-3-methylbut-2-enyl diphosphate reductase n=1 Tax=Selenomonas sp. TaxID=2053611 RepID=UPI0025CDBF66|nr:4-hydroxy-3-methylbut-2-enyl diphosphate reductase [Selenomonas sp.]MBQ1460791.1 4-hydroxy-3-methylbut-2-enyl diphosphate reductase [Selenomonas sp.]MBQ1867708.1 4-hydroxy-3-methylbut-2-enyl diphosphate reductase [Selenomonas sp.]MBQ5501267.1 4-hydroxy-3-methylbut-2-enyl diphosphate reductase [Selenomonas sp.]